MKIKNLKISKKLSDQLIQDREKCPWFKDGKISFPCKPLRDICMIWPMPNPTHFRNGIIEIPEQFQEHYKKSFGVLCAIGPGYHKESGEFIETFSIPGSIVLYDNTVPWYDFVKDSSGKEHYVGFCGEKDIKGILV